MQPVFETEELERQLRMLLAFMGKLPGGLLLLMGALTLARPHVTIGAVAYIEQRYGITAEFFAVWCILSGIGFLIWLPRYRDGFVLNLLHYVLFVLPMMFHSIMSAWYVGVVNLDVNLQVIAYYLGVWAMLTAMFFLRILGAEALLRRTQRDKPRD